MEICPYCGTRHPVSSDGSAANAGPPRCSECGGILDDLSMQATQIAMGPWFFRQPGKPFGPGCDIGILRRMLVAGKLKPESPIRGPATGQLWRRAKYVPGIAHLAGACHACGTSVKPDNKFCPSCGVKFETPEGRASLGLPKAPAQEEIAKCRVIDEAMCPVCGHDKAVGDECHECETIFAPAEDATPIHLGGWFVHGKANAFKPGISLEQLKKEIAAGRVTARAVLRGPTTEQFWTLAKTAPGVANLLGVCHACGAKADAGASSCAGCGASFPVPADDDVLGLRYTTAAEAAAAQKELDDALAELGPAAFTAAKPAPQARATSVEDDAAATVDEIELETRERAQRQRAQQRPAPEAEAEPAAHDESHALAGAGVAAGGFDADAGDLGAGARPRRALQRQSKASLIAAAIITPILIIGAYIGINAMKKGQQTSAKDGDGKAADKSTVKQKGTPSNLLLKLKQDTEARWSAASKGVERTAKLAPVLDKGQAELAKANELLAQDDFAEADAQYRRVFPIADEVERLIKARGAADFARRFAADAKKEAADLEAPKFAKELWDKAEASFAAAAAALQQEDVDKASTTWDAATLEYQKAKTFVLGMREAADARTQIESEATKKFSKTELDAHAVPAWQAFQAKLKAGDEAATTKDFIAAKGFYDQARRMIPSVEVGMQLEIGRIWYAYQAGRLTTRILLAKAAGYHPDDEMLAQIKLAYENLQINRDFYNRIPLSKNCTYKELADVMVVDCGKEIEAAFQTGGDAYKASFAIGLHFMIIDKLLRVDVGKLTPATRQDLEIYLRKIIPDAVKLAGYSPDVLAFLKDVDETLTTEQTIPTKTREKWAAMSDTLEKFDTAMAIMQPKK